MSASKLDVNLDEFKKLTTEFAEMGDKLGEDGKAVILINSLHENYKDYVRNKARLERSIVEVYVMNESSTFCSRYLRGIETRFTRDGRNDDTIVEDESRLLELECHVAINERILMTIAPGEEKPIFPHVIRFSQTISVCLRKTFPFRCLKWADVGTEYIEMLTIFKEFRADCHRHFKKYSDPEETRANPPNALATEDAHNQMLELQFQATPEGSQPLSKDEICDQVLGRRPGYSKGLGWRPKSKVCRTTSASSSSTSFSQSIEKDIELQAKLNEALERIEVQDRNRQAKR
ncbi:CACTA en-spm transposon protein [Cucumis melo var. makuwa]|uniref:CACTA en-spm transposon protein n=1 Tax=Cucumis melo var. makuwa TaxID=1194695 RepID=A0A5A7TY35_CUCMM|nr:CACTA en-spm transposon protein [Cucumis melo var. makuwa]